LEAARLAESSRKPTEHPHCSIFQRAFFIGTSAIFLVRWGPERWTHWKRGRGRGAGKRKMARRGPDRMSCLSKRAISARHPRGIEEVSSWSLLVHPATSNTPMLEQGYRQVCSGRAENPIFPYTSCRSSYFPRSSNLADTSRCDQESRAVKNPVTSPSLDVPPVSSGRGLPMKKFLKFGAWGEVGGRGRRTENVFEPLVGLCLRPLGVSTGSGLLLLLL